MRLEHRIREGAERNASVLEPDVERSSRLGRPRDPSPSSDQTHALRPDRVPGRRIRDRSHSRSAEGLARLRRSRRSHRSSRRRAPWIRPPIRPPRTPRPSRGRFSRARRRPRQRAGGQMGDQDRRSRRDAPIGAPSVRLLGVLGVRGRRVRAPHRRIRRKPVCGPPGRDVPLVDRFRFPPHLVRQRSLRRAPLAPHVRSVERSAGGSSTDHAIRACKRLNGPRTELPVRDDSGHLVPGTEGFMRRRLWIFGTPLLAVAVSMVMQPAGAMPLGPRSVGAAAAGHPTLPTSAPEGSGCPTGGRPATERLPQLTGSLAGALRSYGRELPPGASDDAWYDSGSSFGGGVPVRAVGTFMRQGLASGLTQDQVAAFLSPGFLRGVSDPNGGGGLLSFVGEQADPALFQELAAYAESVRSTEMRPMDAQSSVFRAFPLLMVAYEALAGVPPLDEADASTMVGLAEAGYRAGAADDRSPPGGRQPSAGGGTSLRIRGGRCSARRLRLLRDELPWPSLAGRSRRRGEPAGIPGVGRPDRDVGRRWRSDR